MPAAVHFKGLSESWSVIMKGYACLGEQGSYCVDVFLEASDI